MLTSSLTTCKAEQKDRRNSSMENRKISTAATGKRISTNKLAREFLISRSRTSRK